MTHRPLQLSRSFGLLTLVVLALVTIVACAKNNNFNTLSVDNNGQAGAPGGAASQDGSSGQGGEGATGGNIFGTGGSGGSSQTAVVQDYAGGDWFTTGTLAAARMHHSSVKLKNGKVLVTGGRLWSTCGTLSSAEIYDPSTGHFANVSSMHINRSNHYSLLLNNGHILVAGGFSESPTNGSCQIKPLETSEVYNPDADSWTQYNGPSFTILGGLINQTDGAVLAVQPWGLGTFYEGQGWSFSSTTNEYNWAGTASVNSENSVVFFGVAGPNVDQLRTAVVVTPNTAPVEIAAPVEKVLFFSGVLTPLGSSQFLWTGSATNCDPGGTLSTCSGSVAAKLNTNQTWSLVQDTPFPHFSPTTVSLMGNQVLLSGGAFGEEARSAIFSGDTNTWNLGPSMNTPRSSHSLTVLDDSTVVAIGGVSGNIPQSSCERLWPSR